MKALVPFNFHWLPSRSALVRKRGGIRARARLGQAIARQRLHRAQFRQPCLALLLGAEGVDHPGAHVVDGDEGGDRRAAIGERLEDQCGVEPAEARAADILAHIDAGEAQLADRAHDILGEMPGLVPLERLWREVFVGEGPRHFGNGDLFLAQFEIHVRLPPGRMQRRDRPGRRSRRSVHRRNRRTRRLP